MTRSVMKRTTALALLFAAGLSSGCNNDGKYEVMKDGTKWFGKRVLPDGTTTAKRVEFPSGQKDFDETWHPDGTSQIARVEMPGGAKYFDEIVLHDGTRKVGRVEQPDGEKWFDVTLLPDEKSKKIARSEFPNGEKDFEVTVDKDGKAEIKRVEYPDGRKQFDVTQLADGSRQTEDQRLKSIAEDAAAKRVKSIESDLIGLEPKEVAKRCGHPDGDTRKQVFSEGHSFPTRILIYANAPNGPAGVLWLMSSDNPEFGIFTGVQIVRNGEIAEEDNTPTLSGKHDPEWADKMLTALPCLEKPESSK